MCWPQETRLIRQRTPTRFMKLYFVIGPLRTGSSLLSRCLDDHPHVLGLCESEINRALFSPYYVHLHFLRMLHHGLQPLEIAGLLDRKPQDDVGSLFQWYDRAASVLAERLEKNAVEVVGDKSPDFYVQPRLVHALAQEHRLLYSIRDPRAIFRSIIMHEGSTDEEKRVRWSSLTANFQMWEPLLDRENLIEVRYESLVTEPEQTMKAVYHHLGIAYSDRFLQPFPRLYPSRFQWDTAVDWQTGIRKDFDPERVDLWRWSLSQDDLDFVRSDRCARRMMDRFGYEW